MFGLLSSSYADSFATAYSQRYLSTKKTDSLEEAKAIQLKEFADSDANSRNEAVSKLVEHVQEVTSNINQFGLEYLTARRVINCSTLERMCLKDNYPTKCRKFFQ
ncbi:hypothetical protein HPU229336_03515 [Helicobacter pullorum]|uniref:Uncharacterized protein n=1 Tax=Helicobacter pullorum TaxID=35818 RepID=A0AAW3J8N3_9HELI|nr:hypothetical protein HPU229336_03515 [Helicobacter pullorum]